MMWITLMLFALLIRLFGIALVSLGIDILFRIYDKDVYYWNIFAVVGSIYFGIRFLSTAINYESKK